MSTTAPAKPHEGSHKLRRVSPAANCRSTLRKAVDVLELDVTSDADIAAVAEELERRWGKVDGVLHAIGFAPSCLGGGFLDAPWEDVATAMQVSTYSFAVLGRGFRDLLAAADGASLVGLDFDATVAWPTYDWRAWARPASRPHPGTSPASSALSGSR